MTTQDVRLSNIAVPGGIRTWQYGDLPIPEWVLRHINGNIEANGTFAIGTDVGTVRVHPGHTVIERSGTVWACPAEELSGFIECLEVSRHPTINSIGPGKTRRFGASGCSNRKVRNSGDVCASERPRALPPVGSLPSIEWVHLKRLSVDSTYQRSTENAASRRLIAGIAAKFDWRLCSPLVVSRRPDELLVIIDGQHRWMAACQRDDIPQLPCCVFRYESIQEEARMFIVANRARKPINRLDDYFAALAASDEDALEIEQLVKGAGLNVARSTSATAWRPGEIAFTSGIATAIRRFGATAASGALRGMATAFRGQKWTHGGAIFGALVQILSAAGPDFDQERLIVTLQSRRADDWGLHAAGLLSGARREIAVREAIMEAYLNDSKSDAIGKAA